MEQMLRQCVIALELARLMELDSAESELVFLVAPLAWIGCTSSSHEQAKRFGDDISLRDGVYRIDMTPAKLARYSMSRVGAGEWPAGASRIGVGIDGAVHLAVKHRPRITCTVRLPTAPRTATVLLSLTRGGLIAGLGRARLRHGAATITMRELRRIGNGSWQVTPVVAGAGHRGRTLTLSTRVGRS
jgi:hypothetical protein